MENRSIDLDDRHTWFIPGMTCIKIYDLETGEPRDSNALDLATVTRVADALSNIDAVCISCKNVARSDMHGEIEEFAIMAENTTKPLEYLCEHADSLDVVIDMAAALRGGRHTLYDKPYFLQIITPLPLNYHRTHIDQIIKCVRAGVPVSVGTLPIGGASTPITTAGSMVNSLATDFAGMVLAQLVRRGSFCVGSSDVCFMEPATGGIGNFAQTSLADMVDVSGEATLGLPSFTGAGRHSVARRFNQDAVARSRAGHDAGLLQPPDHARLSGLAGPGHHVFPRMRCALRRSGRLSSHAVAGRRIDCRRSRSTSRGRSGARGNYLAQRHTVAHCRERLWRSRYFGPNLPLSTNARADLGLFQRIDADLRQLVERHRPVPLDTQLAANLRAMRERFAALRPRP